MRPKSLLNIIPENMIVHIIKLESMYNGLQYNYNYRIFLKIINVTPSI